MDKPLESAELLVRTAIATPGALDRLRADPESTLKELAAEAVREAPRVLEQDRFVYRAVILTLSAISLAVVGCAVVLALRTDVANPIRFPDILTALGSAAIGALAGILAPSPRSK